MTEHHDKQYWAFISYSSKDDRWGQWLHHRLENYPIPEEFRGAEVFDGAILGKNLRPIFRDRDELSGASDLGSSIGKALESSHFLIVLCSPNAAKSEWVNKEVESFISMGKGDRILALILDGEPNASRKGRPEVECFPPALMNTLEPIAGDLRRDGDGRDRGFLKILAGITQLDFDELYRRHERAQARKRLLSTIATLALTTVFALLSVFALTQRNSARAAEVRAQGRTADLYLEEARRVLRGNSSEELAVLTQAAYKAQSDNPDLPVFMAAARQGWGNDRRIHTGHRQKVLDVISTPTGFVSGDTSGTVMHWSGDGEMLDESRKFSSSVVFHGAGMRSYDNGNLILDSDSGEVVLEGRHFGPIVSVLEYGSGHDLITASMDGTVWYWDGMSREPLRRLYKGYPVTGASLFSEDDLLVLNLINGETVIINPQDGSVILHDIPRDSVVSVLNDGLFYVSGDSPEASVIRYSGPVGNLEKADFLTLPFDARQVRRILVPGKGSDILLLGYDGRLLYLPESVEEPGRYRYLDSLPALEDISAWTDNDKFFIATTDSGTHLLVSTSTGKVVNQFLSPFEGSSDVHCLAGGTFALTGSSGELMTIDTAGPGTNVLFEGLTGIDSRSEYDQMLYLGDGRYLLGNRENSAVLVSPDGSHTVWHLTGPKDGSVRFSLHPNNLDIVIYSPHEIQIREKISGELKWNLVPDLSEEVFGTVMFAHGIGEEGLVYVLVDDDIASGAKLSGTGRILYRDTVDAAPIIVKERTSVLSGSGDPDGSYWAFRDSAGNVVFYSLASGDYRKWGEYYGSLTAYDPANRLHTIGYTDGEVRFLTSDLKEISRWPETGAAVTSSDIAGNSVCIGYLDGSIRVGLYAGLPELLMKVSDYPVTEIRTVNETSLMVLDSQGKVFLADPERKVILRELSFPGRVTDLFWNKADETLVVLLNDGSLHSRRIREDVEPPASWNRVLRTMGTAFAGNPVVYDAFAYLFPSEIEGASDEGASSRNGDSAELSSKGGLSLVDSNLPPASSLTLRYAPLKSRELLFCNGLGTLKIYRGRNHRQSDSLQLDYALFSSLPSPDGSLIAVAGFSDEILLLDSESMETVHVLKGHTARIASLVFHPDGNLLVSGGRDGIPRLWDVETGTLIREIADLESYVLTVNYLEREGVFFLRSNDGSVWYDPVKDEVTRIFSDESNVKTAISGSQPDQVLLGLVDGRLLSMHPGSAVDPDTILLHEFSDSVDRIVPVSGGLLVNTGGGFSLLSEDELISSWEPHPDGGILEWLYHEDQSLLITVGSGDRSIRTWTLDGRPLSQYTHSSDILEAAFNEEHHYMSFIDSDGNLYELDWQRMSGFEMETGGAYVIAAGGRRLVAEGTAITGDSIVWSDTAVPEFRGSLPGGGFWGISNGMIRTVGIEPGSGSTETEQPWEPDWLVSDIRIVSESDLVVIVRKGNSRHLMKLNLYSGEVELDKVIERSWSVYISDSGYLHWYSTVGDFRNWEGAVLWSLSGSELPVDLVELDTRANRQWISFWSDGKVRTVSENGVEDTDRSVFLEGRPVDTLMLNEDILFLNLDVGIQGTLDTGTGIFTEWNRTQEYTSIGVLESGTIWLINEYDMMFLNPDDGAILQTMPLPYLMDEVCELNNRNLILRSDERLIHLEPLK